MMIGRMGNDPMIGTIAIIGMFGMMGMMILIGMIPILEYQNHFINNK